MRKHGSGQGHETSMHLMPAPFACIPPLFRAWNGNNGMYGVFPLRKTCIVEIYFANRCLNKREIDCVCLYKNHT